jgi:hypothetical protein
MLSLCLFYRITFLSCNCVYTNGLACPVMLQLFVAEPGLQVLGAADVRAPFGVWAFWNKDKRVHSYSLHL